MRRRPTVLHCARDWLRPSEGFVADLVRTTTATRPAVVAGRGWPDAPAVPADVHLLERRLDRVPGRLRPPATAALVGAFAARERAGLLHQHFGYWTPAVAPVVRATRLPWVVSLHGHDLLVEAARDPATLTALGRADALLVPSAYLAGRAVDLGLPADRVRVLPVGVDLARHSFRERGPVAGRPVRVVFAGRFVAKKGVLDVARALVEVARDADLDAVFVGSGPLEAELRQVLAAGGLRAEVRDGARPGAVRAALQEADLVVTGSCTAPDGDEETLGLVNLEALACGAPLVTTRSGGVPEALGGAAVLAAPGDVRGIAAAVAGLLAAPQEWAGRGRAGRAHVALRHELGARTADLEQLYAALLRRDRLPAAPAPAERLPSVTVVIATRDRRALLRRTLDAVLAQTYPRELVDVAVVDNGGTDGSSADLAARASADPRLRVVPAAADLGVAAGRNRAAATSRAEVVVFTDDDCRPVDTWLEALAGGLRTGVDIVQGTTLPDPGTARSALSRSQHTAREYGLYETCNIAYRRTAFEAVGGFDVGLADEIATYLGRRFARFPFGEDTDLAWRAKRAGAVSRFSRTAVVHHHVFSPSTRLLVRRAWVGAAWPLLVDRVPELGPRFLTASVFLGRRRVLAVLALAGLAGGVVRPRARLAVVPYVVHLTRPTAPGAAERWRALPVWALVDAVQTAGLLYGSARARRLVL